MQQQLDETVDAYLEDLQRLVDKTIQLNRDRREPYYIWIAQKPSKLLDVKGRYTIKQHYKVYKTRPPSMVGTIIVMVDNANSILDWEVNPPDVPINFEALGVEVTKTAPLDTSIANSYIYL